MGKRWEQPPLFRDQSNSDGAAEQCDSETVLRKRVKDVLTTGSAGLFLWRSRRKYPKKSWLVFGPALSVFGAEVWLSCVVADWGRWLLEIHLAICHFPLDTRMLTTVALIALWGYLDIFLTYVVMRRVVRRWDLKEYQSLTGEKPTVHWTTSDAPPTGV